MMQYQLWKGSSAIIIKDNRVLMIRTKDSNSWSIPSWRVEVGETAEEACIREVAEETGIPFPNKGKHSDTFY